MKTHPAAARFEPRLDANRHGAPRRGGGKLAFGAAWGCALIAWVQAGAALASEAGPSRELPAQNRSAARPERVTVWLDLSEPALARIAPEHQAEREAQRRRIVAEQDRVAASLVALGGAERGRTRLLRNSLAAELPREQIDAARQIPGVRAVRPVRHIDRPPPHSRD